MSIKFQCEHCRKEVKAPDDAGGKRGKCPFCGLGVYVPAPAGDHDILPLAPIDEEEERRREEEIKELQLRERDIIAETGPTNSTPTDRKEGPTNEDIRHFVVNYCLDMANSKIDRARTHVEKLRSFGSAGTQAVDDFLTGKAVEPALKSLPRKVLQGFLKYLREQLK